MYVLAGTCRLMHFWNIYRQAFHTDGGFAFEMLGPDGSQAVHHRLMMVASFEGR